MARLKLGLVLAVTLSATILCLTMWKSSFKTAGKVTRDIGKNTKADEKQYMQFDDWLTGKFRSSSMYPNWISASEYLYLKSDGAIMKKNISSNEETEFLASKAWTSLSNPSSWYVSADLEYVAITYESTDGYAHYVKTFSIAVFETTTSDRVNIPSFPSDNIQKIKWDPVGHKMAYVRNFNVYVVTNFAKAPIQVTTDGEENVMFNGIADWLYSIEITDDDALLWWSPMGTYLAFAKIDQEGVKDFDFALFGGNLYPNMVSFPYPKPGTKIPATKTFIVDTKLETDAMEVVPSLKVKNWGDFYLNSAIWRNDTIFTPTWKNRYENEAVSESCSSETNWTCTHVSEMESKSETGWLGHYKPSDLVAMPMANEYMTVLSNPDGFPHLVVVDTEDNSKNWRTSGTFEVTDAGSGYQSIHFYDEINDWVYFTSTEKVDGSGDGLPRIRHLWRVKAHENEKTRECVTCDLNVEYVDRCNWVRPSFSPGGSYVVVNCGGTGNGAPISTLHKIYENGTIGDPVVVENNDNLLTNLEAYHFRTREYGSITLPDVEGEYYYTLHKPPLFDANKKYPMLVQVYSGPGYQEVQDRFAVGWKDFVASSLDVIVMSFDGRGTGFRGDNIMHKVYQRLGQYEPADQIAAAKKLAKDNQFINAVKTAIWGWSYGGYATTRAIGEDSEGVFKCGYAVAPVTDWLSYHTIYTERYMKSPSDNQENYNKSTTMQKFENFKNHQYFLFHGTADENVHFQNSARLSKALIDHDVDFGAFFAADDDHGLGKIKNDYRNLYKMITRQMCRCFSLDKPNVGVVCPGYQYTADYWSVDWARGYIASSDLDIVVMTFDGRGTGFRGDKIMHQVYKKLGEYEPIDQIEAAKQISNMHNFIDKERIAIWGRSYGGYATSRTIAEDVDLVFKCGFSVAPVTDWLTYHSIYTERYMTSPDVNGKGYNDSTAIQKLENFGKHYFVLVHGTSDENVHFLNSARLSKALIAEGVDFIAYFAGDETHSFTRGANAYGHHYKLLTHHVKTCFGL